MGLAKGSGELEKIAEACAGIAVSLGLPIQFGEQMYNASALICDKEVLGFVCKQHLASSGVYYEPRWFSAWLPGVSQEIRIVKRVIR